MPGTHQELAGYVALVGAVVLAVLAAVAFSHSRRLVRRVQRKPPADYQPVIRRLLRLTRTILVFLAGMVVLAIGAFMMVGPGPGLVVVVIGLAILATEFVWARVWLARVRRAALAVGERVGVTARALPPNASPWRRALFHVGRWVAAAAARLGLTGLAARIARRLGIDRVLQDSDPDPP